MAGKRYRVFILSDKSDCELITIVWLDISVEVFVQNHSQLFGESNDLFLSESDKGNLDLGYLLFINSLYLQNKELKYGKYYLDTKLFSLLAEN